ncbi:response regulator [Hymenobacter setariae]|uniref:Response regulator n=1 Tax=Hymenobacter setariae TaxID=2594794 RepID=A0A558BUQ9_9BACT|nr:response regulator [Hymenobacter setariae]TVT40264.1 response regulator [Hymenobacter setariae]
MLSSILLVDDDPTTNFLNQTLVRRAQVADNVLVAENGRVALQMLETTCTPDNTKCPTLILLDVNMPVMNGIEFLEAYQQRPQTQQQATIIILLTTTVLARDLDRLQQLPIHGVLDKPLTTAKLQMVIDQYFAHAKT